MAIGEGKTVIGFIPASQVDEAISMFEQEATKEALERAQIIRDARADIPKLMVRVPQLPKAAKAGSKLKGPNMKLFTATKKTQGQRAGDFFWCEAGEIVYFGVFRCSTEEKQKQCGCYRSMVGLASGKATTTFQVEEVSLGLNHLARLIYASWESGGWLTLPPESPIASAMGPFTLARARQIAEDLELAALPFEVGDVCECAGMVIRRRGAAITPTEAA